MTPHKFKIGDRVRPKPNWLSASIPSGKVENVSPWGKGQVLKIEGASGYRLSGCFELDVAAAGARAPAVGGGRA